MPTWKNQNLPVAHTSSAATRCTNFNPGFVPLKRAGIGGDDSQRGAFFPIAGTHSDGSPNKRGLPGEQGVDHLCQPGAGLHVRHRRKLREAHGPPQAALQDVLREPALHQSEPHLEQCGLRVADGVGQLEQRREKVAAVGGAKHLRRTMDDGGVEACDARRKKYAGGGVWGKYAGGGVWGRSVGDDMVQWSY